MQTIINILVILFGIGTGAFLGSIFGIALFGDRHDVMLYFYGIVAGLLAGFLVGYILNNA